ncbi:hypothetical protein PIB30_041139 [Stylosanthes scabra]|uniref:Peptide N-acetyl-beta-D-glucosaminyl asparaginase amidase A N-terminal domain-containing protein n=1 Tax=Stylosanthes scabra TaxID=79078 RepID=A0ABU6SEQ0_9FABA|nr:hypothetical protein [Stylosanthes scabra]
MEFFEVTKPIELPKTKPYSILVLSHDFAYTYGEPPVLANYTLPSDFKSQRFSKIVLEWMATCKGKQFDRIFGVWLAASSFCGAAPPSQRPPALFGVSRKTYKLCLVNTNKVGIPRENVFSPPRSPTRADVNCQIQLTVLLQEGSRKSKYDQRTVKHFQKLGYDGTTNKSGQHNSQSPENRTS